MGLRSIAALSLPDITPAVIGGSMPRIIMADPRLMLVDEKYQRGLSERSLKLIRKIVGQWNWASFKPPVVTEVDGQLHVIDGQHTAIGAVTHGGIAEIPVLLVDALSAPERAASFAAHNRDRIAVTSTQLHAAMVEAGDEDAMTIAQVCERAGVEVLKHPPSFARFEPGQTMAVACIRALVNRRHAMGARRVLEICAKARLAPVSAQMIRAVEHLLFAEEYRDEIKPEVIETALAIGFADIVKEASRFSAERNVLLWRATASVIFMNRKRWRHG